MNTWSVTEGRSRFSDLVRMAIRKGPQTLTKRGIPVAVAVVVSAQDFQRVSPRETFLEFLAPLKGSGIRLTRHRDLPRKIVL